MSDPFAVKAGGLVYASREIEEEARIYSLRARSPATLLAYAHDWSDFEAWCAARRARALPASCSTVIEYFTERARTLKVSSLGRRLAAISVAHQRSGHEHLNPAVAYKFKEFWRGLRRTKGAAVSKKNAISAEDLRRMIGALPAGTAAGARDRAILLVGFAGAFRRSELVGLDVTDLSFLSGRLDVTIRRSQTDQEMRGAIVSLPHRPNPETCPTNAMRRWLEASGITDGPVFRPITRWGKVRDQRLTGFAVPIIIRGAARAAGIDPRRFSGHSLRAGFASAAAAQDIPESDVMAHMRQRSVSVHRGNVRSTDGSKRNPAGRLELW